MPEDTPMNGRSVADPEPEAEPLDTTPARRNKNNRCRNERDGISKDWQRVTPTQTELNEEPEVIESSHEAKENASEPSLTQPRDKDDVNGGDEEDELDRDWEVMEEEEELKASPNCGKEEPIVVNSAPNGGSLKAAKGGW